MRTALAPPVVEETLGLHGLTPASLDEVVENAALLRRVDRKYLVPLDAAARLVRELASSHAVLEIAGRRSTTYNSMYFDTAGLDSLRAHVQRRRRRWKVRQRWYVEDGLCRIEVKTKDRRRGTVKVVSNSTMDSYGRLGGDDGAFVESVLGPDHPNLRVAGMIPASEVTYSRATLVDLSGGTRLTFDWDLVASLSTGAVTLDESVVLVETKGGPIPGPADHVLRGLGVRERAFSKYASSGSLIVGGVADNDVRQLRNTVLHVHQHPSEGIS